MTAKKKLKMGMVGGGKGSAMGDAHRLAADMDGRIELVAGAFNTTRIKSRETGSQLDLDMSRVYGNYREMFRREAKRPAEEKMDFVAVATPNNMHYPIAMAALDAGYHVICDKPMTLTLDEALNLRRKIQATERHFCLLNTYRGYSMVDTARQLVGDGEIGNVRRIVCEYAQGWLATRQETSGLKQAMWRTDPRRSGASGCVGDIGRYLYSLARYVTGLEARQVSADLSTFVKGRQLDDDGCVLLRFDNDIVGTLWASQIAVGESNSLRLRLLGETGTVEWNMSMPHELKVQRLGKEIEILKAPAPRSSGQLPDRPPELPQHPPGFEHAFAELYRRFADVLIAETEGNPVPEDKASYPTVDDGILNIAFVEAVVASSQAEEKWVDVTPDTPRP